MMCDPERYDEILKPHLEKGFAKAAGKKSLENFDVMTSCTVIVSDDVKIRDLFLSGKRPEAIAAVPEALELVASELL